MYKVILLIIIISILPLWVSNNTHKTIPENDTPQHCHEKTCGTLTSNHTSSICCKFEEHAICKCISDNIQNQISVCHSLKSSIKIF